MFVSRKILLAIVLIIITGCSYYSINNQKDKLELICIGMNAALDCFHENEEYKYCFSYQGNYLKINDERISFSKAIEEKKVTIDDIINLSKNEDKCSLYKINKNTNEYEDIY